MFYFLFGSNDSLQSCSVMHKFIWQGGSVICQKSNNLNTSKFFQRRPWTDKKIGWQKNWLHCLLDILQIVVTSRDQKANDPCLSNWGRHFCVSSNSRARQISSTCGKDWNEILYPRIPHSKTSLEKTIIYKMF